VTDNPHPTLTGDMAPSESPGGRRRFAGVRRVNNLPIWIVGAIALAFVLIAMTIALQRSQHAAVQSQDKPVSQKQSDAARSTSAIFPKMAGGIAPVAGAPPAPGTVPWPAIDVLSVPVTAPPPDDLPPPAGSYGSGQAGNAPPQPTPAQLAREKRRAARLALFEAAVAAPSRVDQVSARSAGSPPSTMASSGPPDLTSLRAQLATSQGQGDATTAAAQAQLAEFERDAGNAGEGAGRLDGQGISSAAIGRPDRAIQFGAQRADDRWRLKSAVEPPRTPFELRTGFVIPATLISGINSELPGQIVGQVSQNVWDTPTGKYLLIPQGSRLVGIYSSSVAYGQRRVLVAWQRIIFPDGKALDIGTMPGADGAGYAGYHDKVNTHFFRVISQAVLLSGVTAGIALSQPQNTITANGQITGQAALTQALGQNLGLLITEMVRKNLNVSPTLVIRPGFRFNVVVVKDLTFSKPYKGFDY
jgi:type IV secretion system protein TrbI